MLQFMSVSLKFERWRQKIQEFEASLVSLRLAWEINKILFQKQEQKYLIRLLNKAILVYFWLKNKNKNKVSTK